MNWKDKVSSLQNEFVKIRIFLRFGFLPVSSKYNIFRIFSGEKNSGLEKDLRGG